MNVVLVRVQHWNEWHSQSACPPVIGTV